MSEIKHTPTPWVAIDEYIYSQDRFEIGTTTTSGFDYGTDDANAAHIVKCVNMHDELVEALKEINDLNENHSPFGGEMYQDRIDRELVRETLKKAGAL